MILEITMNTLIPCLACGTVLAVTSLNLNLVAIGIRCQVTLTTRSIQEAVNTEG